MSSPKEQINITPQADEMIIRHGEAPQPNNPQAVKISGHIDTPFNYYRQRAGETFHKENAHLEVDTQRKKITLFCNPSDRLAPVITGSIKKYGPLDQLGINGDKTYCKDQFKKVMKRNRFLFADASECTALVSKLSSLEVKVEQQLKDSDDDRGNRSLKYEQTCQSELPGGFTLHCPIFVEGDTQDIMVDICFNVNASSEPQFWLESPTLHEIIEEQTTAMIAETVANFNDEIAIIYQ